MAGNALIGALRVSLGLDSAQFSRGVAQAKGSLDTLGSHLKAFAVGFAGAFTFDKAVEAIAGVIEKADQMGKTAQKIGIPVEELSKLQYAAKLADVGTEQLTTGVERLARNMQAFAAGAVGPASNAFKALGISATDASGNLRPAGDVLRDIAAKFADMKDGAGKTALAIALFGRAGAELIPMLNLGKEGLAAASEEAAKFHIVITEKTAVAAESFQDNLKRLGAAGQGLALQVAEKLLPSLVALTDNFINIVSDGTAATEVFSVLNPIVDQTSKTISDLNRAYSQLVQWWVTIKALGSIFTKDETSGSFEAVQNFIVQIKKNFDEANDSAVKLGTTISNLADKVPKEKILVNAPHIQTAEELKAQQDELKKIQEQQKRWAIEAAQIWDGARSSVEVYADNVRKLDQALADGIITQGTYDRAVAKLKEEFQNVGYEVNTLGKQIDEALGTAVQDWLDQAIDGTFKWQDALSGLAKQLAKLAVNNLLMNIMAGFGGGAGVAPSQQTGGIFGSLGKLFGFATGGSFTVGGSGGIDSKMVAFKATPGERVDISTRGQQRSQNGITYNIDARGADAQQIAKLREDLRTMNRDFSKNVKAAVSGEKSLNPRFAT